MTMRPLVLLIATTCLTAGCGSPPPSEAPPEASSQSSTEPARPDPWRDARERGIEFRAIGQEPGWLLEIDEGVSMRLLYDYGERTAIVNAPTLTVEDGRRAYAGLSGTNSVNVVIEDRPCSDIMSGDPFPATVTVTINDRTLNGCGREL
jgi:putative lipoprotein